MNATELHYLLETKEPPLTLNVLPPEVHSATRIPGSLNACVYETAFVDQVGSLIPDKNAVIVVYGAGEGSLSARVAAEKLRSAGYSNVGVLDDGLDGWKAAGLPLVGNKRLPAPPVLHGTYQIDTAASLVRWTGRNPFNQHYGTVRLASGEIRIREGTLEAARFAIDMNSIACDDLTDSQWNAMLIAHLRTADFFQVDRFPTAEFVADEIEHLGAKTEGIPNYLIKGQATVRGVTRPLDFPAVIASADGTRLTGQAQFEIDRTEFGSIYGSGKFFRFLGKHVVNDAIHLQVMIHADLTGTKD